MDPIAQAQEYAFKSGIRPDEFWRLTPWELGQWFKAKSKEMQDAGKMENMMSVATAWRTAKYMRFDFPRSLKGELDIEMRGTGELSPEASKDHLASYFKAVNASSMGSA